jgi:hypothetical protein
MRASRKGTLRLEIGPIGLIGPIEKGILFACFARGAGRSMLEGAPGETTLRWPRTSVELQAGAGRARSAFDRSALASRGTASSNAELYRRRRSAGGGSAA